MRISDWSSDVCSSDLVDAAARHFGGEGGAHVIIETLVAARGAAGDAGLGDARVPDERHLAPRGQRAAAFDRDDAVERGLALGARGGETLRQAGVIGEGLARPIIVAEPGQDFGRGPTRQDVERDLLADRSEEHTSELQSIIRLSYSV